MSPHSRHAAGVLVRLGNPLAVAYDRHSKAEEKDRARGRHKDAYEHHGAILLLTRMCKEAER